MVCIECGGNTKVTNSRHQKRLNQIWRRRQCLECGALFSTEETAAYEAAWAVRGAKGNVSPFSSDKLFLSLYRSCQHRPAAARDARALTDTITKKLLASVQNGLIDSQVIISAAQVALQRFDKAAGVHYQAFHS